MLCIGSARAQSSNIKGHRALLDQGLDRFKDVMDLMELYDGGLRG